MKILIIGPTNMKLMPYLNFYIEVLKKYGCEYEIIEWDRLGIGSAATFTYEDKKRKHRRGLVDYWKFCSFIKRIIKKGHYQKIIISSVQLGYFLKSFLIQNYPNNYIFDIRDYNKILKLFSINKVVKYAFQTVISSPGFHNFLPENDRIFVNHNTRITRKIFEDRLPYPTTLENPLCISYIGSFRALKENELLIESLGNNDNFKFFFHGYGRLSKNLKELVEKSNYRNVSLTGQYEKHQEEKFYLDADIINILEFKSDISENLLPNRLYNALFYGKPIIVTGGTYLSEVVRNNNLGFVIDLHGNIEKQFQRSIDAYDSALLEKGRADFFNQVFLDNERTEEMVKAFIFNEASK